MMERYPRPGSAQFRLAMRFGALRAAPCRPGRLFLRAASGTFVRPPHARPDRDYLERCEDRGREELAGRGLPVDEDGYMDLHHMQCEVAMLPSGTLATEYMPAGTGLGAGQAARMMLALLGSVPARDWPAIEPSLALHDAVTLLLRASGLSTRTADTRNGVHQEVVVTNPAARGRGTAWLFGSECVRWECRLAVSGRPGINPAQAADAIAAALAEARPERLPGDPARAAG
jgi:hypothetical protein